MKIKTFPFPNLETERLILRQINIDDAPEVFAIRSHPINTKYTARESAKTMEDALMHIRKLIHGMENDEWINWTLTLPGIDQAIGFIGFWNYHETLSQVDIGYELHPDYHGKGYMTEAMKVVLAFGLENLGIETINAELHRDNMKSLNLLKRYDFVQDESFHLEDEEDIILWQLKKW